MRTILHLSDLHFGQIDPATLDPLLQAAREIRPDVNGPTSPNPQLPRTSMRLPLSRKPLGGDLRA